MVTSDMVFSSSSSSFYLPLDSDQGVTFYKNENALFTPHQQPTSVVCRRNQDNTMSPGGEQPFFGNNSHGTVVVDAVRQDFAPVAHLSSNGYYGYVPPSPKMMSTAVQLEDAAMDCGEMENSQPQQNQQHQRKRKDYGEEVAAAKRRKTWLEEEQQAAAFPQTFGWNQLPYAHQQMDCNVEDSAAPMATVVANSCNGSPMVQTTVPAPIPVAMVTPIPQQVQPPQSKYRDIYSSRCMMSHMI